MELSKLIASIGQQENTRKKDNETTSPINRNNKGFFLNED